MNTKNNARSQASREALRRALLVLLEGQELPEITVARLCREAGVNRSTFYAHYENIWDVLEELEEEMDQALRAEFRWVTDYESAMLDERSYLLLTQQIAAHPAFFRTRYNNPSVRSGRFDSGMHWLYEEVMDALTAQGRNSELLPYSISFLSAGIMAVLQKWVNGNCREKPEEIAMLLYQLVACKL